MVTAVRLEGSGLPCSVSYVYSSGNGRSHHYPYATVRMKYMLTSTVVLLL